MVFHIINKLPRPIRVWLKNGVLRRPLHRRLAESTSGKIVFLAAEKMRNQLGRNMTGRNNDEIANTIQYKKEALRHFKFISQPSEFQKNVVYPLLVKFVVFLVGVLVGVIIDRM